MCTVSLQTSQQKMNNDWERDGEREREREREERERMLYKKYLHDKTDD